MDITQIVIIISLLASTTIIVICGIYLINILKDIKVITSSVAKPINTFSELLMNFKNIFEIANTYFNRSKKSSKSEHTESHESTHKSTPKSFFKPKH